MKEPVIGSRVFIADTARVLGDAHIGDDCSIWFGAVVRADIERITIGPGTNIQDNVVVHADEGLPTNIGSGVTVGHCAVVHGCRVGDGAMIGIGAILLNGAVIGDGAVVAAGAVVREGQHIPPMHLAAGVPASVKCELAPDQQAGISANAENYRRLAEQYRDEAEG